MRISSGGHAPHPPPPPFKYTYAVRSRYIQQCWLHDPTNLWYFFLKASDQSFALIRNYYAFSKNLKSEGPQQSSLIPLSRTKISCNPVIPRLISGIPPSEDNLKSRQDFALKFPNSRDLESINREKPCGRGWFFPEALAVRNLVKARKKKYGERKYQLELRQRSVTLSLFETNPRYFKGGGKYALGLRWGWFSWRRRNGEFWTKKRERFFIVSSRYIG